MKKIIILFSGVIMMASCSKEELSLKNVNPDLLESAISTEYDASIWIRANTTQLFVNRPSMKINFTNYSDGKPVNVGNVSIQNFNFSYDNTGYNNSVDGTNTQEIVNSFGKSIQVGIEGNKEAGYLPFTSQIDLPSFIDITREFKESLSIKKNEPLNLVWMNPEQGYNMIVRVNAHGAFNGNSTPKVLPTYFKYVNDIGNFSIPYSELQKFEGYEKVSISLTRFNAESVKAGEKKVAIIGYTNYHLGNYMMPN